MVCTVARGSGRKPGATLNTRKRLPPSLPFSVHRGGFLHVQGPLSPFTGAPFSIYRGPFLHLQGPLSPFTGPPFSIYRDPCLHYRGPCLHSHGCVSHAGKHRSQDSAETTPEGIWYLTQQRSDNHRGNDNRFRRELSPSEVPTTGGDGGGVGDPPCRG